MGTAGPGWHAADRRRRVVSGDDETAEWCGVGRRRAGRGRAASARRDDEGDTRVDGTGTPDGDEPGARGTRRSTSIRAAEQHARRWLTRDELDELGYPFVVLRPTFAWAARTVIRLARRRR